MDWRYLAISESLKKNDIVATDRLARALLGLDGGKGSGNFGHKGRPGKVGGSGSGGSSEKGDVEEGKEISKEIIEIASSSRDYVDFWMSLPENEQKKLKSKEAIQSLYEDAKSLSTSSESSEWKPAVGTPSDMPKRIKIPEKKPKIRIYNNPNDTATAHAGKMNEIEINLANYDPENADSVISHEAAHQLANNDPELQQAIIMNYGNVFGRYNQKKGYFDGIYGEYSPEEAYATGFANYRNYPESMKQKYPEAYKFYDDLVKNQPEVMQYLDDTVDKAKTLISYMKKLKEIAKQIDVTDEYRMNATPGVGNYSEDKHAKQGDKLIGKWLFNTFGGDLRVLENSGENGKRSPDFLWKGKLWELQTPENWKPGKADSHTHEGIKQIRENPGGIVLDLSGFDVEIDEAEAEVVHRMRRSASDMNADVIIIHKGKDYKVLRFNEMK